MKHVLCREQSNGPRENGFDDDTIGVARFTTGRDALSAFDGKRKAITGGWVYKTRVLKGRRSVLVTRRGAGRGAANRWEKKREIPNAPRPNPNSARKAISIHEGFLHYFLATGHSSRTEPDIEISEGPRNARWRPPYDLFVTFFFFLSGNPNESFWAKSFSFRHEFTCCGGA